MNIIQFFRENPGLHRTKDLLNAGIHCRDIYKNRDNGKIINVGYGIYRLADDEPSGKSVYAELSLRVPRGVFCLISALNYHNIGTQLPYQHWLAIPQGTKSPNIPEYDINFTFFSQKSYSIGIETVIIDGVEVRIYSPAKTVIDCFKQRNKLGLEVAIEALKEVLREKKTSIREILEIAEICRMKNVIMPYLEAI